MELSKSAEKVQSFLQSQGVLLKVVELSDSTHTASDAAMALTCEVAQIAKTVVFKTEEDKPVLVVASGTNRVDVRKLKAHLGFNILNADAKFVKEQLQFAIGGVPPISHDPSIAVFIDEDLQSFDTLWAAAGTPRAVFSLTFDQLLHLSHGTVLDVKKEPVPL